jgi:hypothetical protein
VALDDGGDEVAAVTEGLASRTGGLEEGVREGEKGEGEGRGRRKRERKRGKERRCSGS